MTYAYWFPSSFYSSRKASCEVTKLLRWKSKGKERSDAPLRIFYIIVIICRPSGREIRNVGRLSSVEDDNEGLTSFLLTTARLVLSYT